MSSDPEMEHWIRIVEWYNLNELGSESDQELTIVSNTASSTQATFALRRKAKSSIKTKNPGTPPTPMPKKPTP